MSISVVTCCMNRNDQLAETIRQWLNRAWVDEIVIVDWNSETPVAETLRDVADHRIRIVRAEGESNWILSYAYNLGIVHATSDMILKIDADCIIDDRVVIDCRPDAAHFFAGNWRSADARNETKSVNGQCFFTRGAFEAVNGFSEVIRGWGFDDEDFYHRMEAQGMTRGEIPCEYFKVIDHSDHRRIAYNPPNDGRVAQRLLEQQPFVQQTKNIVVSIEMPWGPWFSRARYRRMGAEGATVTVQRLRDLEIPLPPAIKSLALLQAGRMLLHKLGLDPVTVNLSDYAGVVDLFEQWLQTGEQIPAAA